jgi:myo-inositol-1(or 4)-monophosphatase
VLIVEEAGGRVTDFKGGPFQLNSRETLASNGLVHQALMSEFEQIFSGNDLEPLPDVQAFRK